MPRNPDKAKADKMFRQGFRGTNWVYLLAILLTLGISTAAHIGMKDVHVPASLFAYADSRPGEMEVTWDFSKSEKPEDQAEKEKEEEPPEPPKPKYVETNPDAPENEPDETINESNRNQQAAQEELDPELEEGDAPKTEGEEDVAPKIVQGTFSPNQPAPPPQPGVYQLTPSPPPAEKTEDTDGQDQEKAQAPLPPPPAPAPIEEGEGEGVATVEQNKFPEVKPNPSKIIPLALPQNPIPSVKTLQEKTPQRSQVQPQPVTPVTPKPIKPRPRPRLPSSVLPGPLKDNRTNAPRIGRLGTDAKWSEFGEYSQRMFAAIGLQWNKLVYNANLNSIPVSKVHVRFILNKEGHIVSIEIPENTAGQLPAFLCTDAIESRAPFGKWTEEMIAKFGDQTDVNVHFNYR